jgi:HEPN domain-containing protein
MTGQLDASTMLSIAIRDFNDLSKMADPENCSDALFGFLAQQTAEKAFKAWIAVAGEVYPFTHDVVSLIDILKRLGEEIPDAFANLDQFSDFGVQFRYTPNENVAPIRDREHVIDELASVIEFVRKRIGT